MSIKDKAAKGLVWNFAGKLHFALVRYLESIILVRLLGPTEYALYAGSLNLNALAVMLSALGIETAIARFFTQYKAQNDAPRARAFFWSALTLRAALQTLTAAVLFVLSGTLAHHFLGGADKAYLVRAAAVLSVSMAIQNLFVRLLVSLYKQKFLNLLTITVYSAYLLVIWWLAKSGYDASAVLWAYVGLMTTLAAITGLKFLREFKVFGEIAKGFELKRVLAFSGFLYLYTLLNFVLGKGLDIMLLGKLAPAIEEITYYALGFNLAFFSVGFFGLALTEGFATSLTVEIATTRPEKLRELFNTQFEYLFFFAIPISFGGMVVAKDLILGLYGSKVLGAVPVALVFFPLFLYTKLGALTSTFLPALDRERTLVYARLVYGAFNIALNLMLIPKYGALGAAIGTAIASFFGIAYEVKVTHRLVRPRYPWGFLAKTLVAAAVMCIVTGAATASMSAPPLARAAAAIALGAATFAIASIVLKPISPTNAELMMRTGLPMAKTIARLLSRIPEG